MSMPIVEVAIRTCRGESGLTQPGDIIVAREPSMGIGRKEMQNYLWLWIEVDDIQAFLLTESSEQDKREYCIPLDLLKQRVPDLDLARATNPSERYQPFIKCGSDGLRTSVPEAKQIGDLVYRKSRKAMIYAN